VQNFLLVLTLIQRKIQPIGNNKVNEWIEEQIAASSNPTIMVSLKINSKSIFFSK
jgi:hypothetical protein